MDRRDFLTLLASAPISVEVLKRLLRVRVVIDNLSIRCFTETGFAFPFKLIDVLLGPLWFLNDVSEGREYR